MTPPLISKFGYLGLLSSTYRLTNALHHFIGEGGGVTIVSVLYWCELSVCPSVISNICPELQCRETKTQFISKILVAGLCWGEELSGVFVLTRDRPTTVTTRACEGCWVFMTNCGFGHSCVSFTQLCQLLTQLWSKRLSREMDCYWLAASQVRRGEGRGWKQDRKVGGR